MNGPIGATDWASEFNVVDIEIGDEVVAGFTCVINGKLGNDMADTDGGGGSGDVSDGAIEVVIVGADGGLYFDSDRGVRSKAPCDMSDGAGDD